MRYKVHKFGGSSLSNGYKIQNIINLLSLKNEAIVVSAMGKTTNNLILSLNTAKNGDSFIHILKDIYNFHCNIIDQIIKTNEGHKLKREIRKDFKTINSLLDTVSLIKQIPINIEHLVLGFGEIFSAQIINLYLQSLNYDSKYLNASKVLVINDEDKPFTIEWNISQNNIDNWLQENKASIILITGFVANNLDGNRTILGMNGSDYSAAIFAKLLKAENLTIWTDVSGAFSGNPSQVKNAQTIKSLSYKEALEMAYFGASVIHPRTIAPAMDLNIPIIIKSSYLNKKEDGTIIHSRITKSSKIIKAVSSLNKITLINIQGVGMIGVSGIAMRVFASLKQHNISVITISQASSEYSLCFSILKKDASKTMKILYEEFKNDINNNLLEKIEKNEDCTIISVVGDGMIGNSGCAGKLFNALSKANINLLSISQGSSQRSITAIIPKKDEIKSLNIVHDAFYNPYKKVAIALIGIGNIGQELMSQMKNMFCKIKEKYLIDLQVILIMNSKKMILSDNNLLDEDNYLDKLYKSSNISDTNILINHFENSFYDEKIIIDLTSSQKISNKYIKFLENKINIVSANKKANSGDLNFYHQIREVALKNKVNFLYETNIGAGLPIIKTLQEINDTGDKVLEISGVFSGTLSYIFSKLQEGLKFSYIVDDAINKAYTEPDARDDLSGMDVARKLIILAREINCDISLKDLKVENLTPKDLQDISKIDKNEFEKNLQLYDKDISHKLEQIKGDNLGIHYIAKIDIRNTKKPIFKVGIESFDKNSPLSSLDGTDNIIIIYTERYKEKPLVIQGAGAGKEVTAMGVFADILSISKKEKR